MSFHTFPFGTPLLQKLADHVIHHTQDDPLSLARWEIYLPTRRACKTFVQLLRTQRACLFLPTLLPLGEVRSDFPGRPSLKPLSSLRLLSLLSALVATSFNDIPAHQADMVTSLLSFLEEMAREEIDMTHLHTLVPDAFAEHWQLSLSFLNLLSDHWPTILEQEGGVPVFTHQQALLTAQMNNWRQSPPSHPILAAGSTASIPLIGRFLETIAQLPQGQVWLLGYTGEEKEDLPPTHACHTLQRLLKRTGNPPVPSLLTSPPRAPTCFTYVAQTTYEEADAIAFLLREVLEHPTRTGLLITPDTELADHVIHRLTRWGVVPDDSRGVSLLKHPLGTLLSLSLLPLMPWTHLLTLLKHPIVAPWPRPEFLAAIHDLEHHLLRQIPAPQSLKSLLPFLENEQLSAFLQALYDASRKLQQLTRLPSTPLTDILAHHADLITLLAPGALDDPTLFSFADLMQSAHGLTLGQMGSYRTYMETVLKSLRIPQETSQGHPRLRILGLYESRLMTADRIILGGLNEGVWPEKVSHDPWLGDALRRPLGLPVAEARIGYAAHDFESAFTGEEVILTRALFHQGAPSQPSRFLSLLLARTPLPPHPQAEAWVKALHENTDAPSYSPPLPSPPLTARPRQVSVSDVSVWVRNPYVFYAKKILKLAPLETLEKKTHQKEFGILLHKIFQQFLPLIRQGASLEDGWAILDHTLPFYLKSSPAYSFWHAKGKRILAWFFQENQRLESHDYLEVRGEKRFPGPHFSTTLVAIADRIAVEAGGRTSIIDYKTGQLPTKSAIEWGLAPQLSLEALLFQEGGFGEIPSSAFLHQLCYWNVHGKGEGGECVPLSKTPAFWAEGAQRGLMQLLCTYQDPHQPYVPTEDAIDGAYAHLVRLKEWNHA